MNNRVIQIIGWLGALCILTAYVLVSFSVIFSQSVLFQGLNFFGALGIVIETYSKRDFQPLALNLFWCIVAFVAILKLVI